ncbi:MAG: hypothetical protein ACR2PS_05600 [Pseudomonadales bacterium]
MTDTKSEITACRRAIDQTETQINTAINALNAAFVTLADLRARLFAIQDTPGDRQ